MADNTANNVFNGAEKGIKIADVLLANLADILKMTGMAVERFFDERDHSKEHQELNEYRNNGGILRVIFCKDDIYNSYMEKELKKSGIVTVPYETSINGHKLCEGFIYKNNDEKTVMQIRDKVLVEHALVGEVTPEMLKNASSLMTFRTESGKEQELHSVNKIKGLDENLANRIAQQARDNGFSIAIEPTGAGLCDVMFLPTHRQKFMRTWLMTEELDISNERYMEPWKEIAKFHVENVRKIEESLSNPAKERVVSEVGEDREWPVLEIGETELVFHYLKDNKERKETLSRNDPNFQKKYEEWLREFTSPVAIEKADFVFDKEKRQRVIREKCKKPEMPELEGKWLKQSISNNRKIMKMYEERYKEELKILDDRQQLIEMKYAHVNNEERHVFVENITNELESFKEFAVKAQEDVFHKVGEVENERLSRALASVMNHEVEIADLEDDLEAKIDHAARESREEKDRSSRDRTTPSVSAPTR